MEKKWKMALKKNSFYMLSVLSEERAEVSSLVLHRDICTNVVMLFWLLAEKNHQILFKETALLFWMHATTQGFLSLLSSCCLCSAFV